MILANLNLMITKNCNFKCRHCLRGDSENLDISSDTLNNIFRPKTVIFHLELNGGEVFSKPDLLRNIIDIIIKNRVLVLEVSIPTNGTLFTEEILSIIDRLNSYVIFCNTIRGFSKRIGVNIDLSKDDYHLWELKRFFETNSKLYEYYVSNINRLRRSKYFAGYKNYRVLQNLGRAMYIKQKKVEHLVPNIYYLDIDNKTFISYLEIDYMGNIITNIGLVNINSFDINSIIRQVGIPCFSLEEFNKAYNNYLTDERNEVLK